MTITILPRPRLSLRRVATPLRSIAPDIHAEPRVNGSIFRINRDIRFSKDKTPYKDHLDLWFWEGNRKGAVSGFFLQADRDDTYSRRRQPRL